MEDFVFVLALLIEIEMWNWSRDSIKRLITADLSLKPQKLKFDGSFGRNSLTFYDFFLAFSSKCRFESTQEHQKICDISTFSGFHFHWNSIRPRCQFCFHRLIKWLRVETCLVSWIRNIKSVVYAECIGEAPQLAISDFSFHRSSTSICDSDDELRSVLCSESVDTLSNDATKSSDSSRVGETRHQTWIPLTNLQNHTRNLNLGDFFIAQKSIEA